MMKKNITLSLIFFFLVGVAYYIEEIAKKEKQEEKYNAVSLLEKKEEISFFKKTDLTLERKEKWMVPNLNYPADKELIDELLKVLKGIQKLKTLPIQNEKDFFSQTNIPFVLKTNLGIKKYVLGDVNIASGYFYLKVENEIFLCEDVSYFSGTYKSDADLNLKKYLRLKGLLVADRALYLHKDPLVNYKIKGINKVKIDNKQHRWYELYFQKNQTFPKTFLKNGYLDVKKKFLHHLSGLRLLQLHDEGQFILADPIGEIILYYAKEKTLKLKLYASLNGKYGRFLRIGDSLRVYEVHEKTTDVFYHSYQKYWNKKFLSENEIRTLKSLKFSLQKKKGSFEKFSIDSLENFSIRAINEKTRMNDNMMNFIFNLIFNLADFLQPKYVQELEGDVLDKKDHDFIELKLLGRHFRIILAKGEVIVTELKTKLVYYFDFDTSQFPAGILQSIFTVKEK